MDFMEFLHQAARVAPSRRQLEWFQMEFYAFVHFGINTYTGREWGTGEESPELFFPAELDCDQWVRSVKAAGAQGIVITAKHHDGFCLWPSKYTEHSVKSSPWRGGKGDVVREVSEACQRGGIKFGFYLSPWDRNCPLYGTPAYNDYYKKQLTELLTEYGEVFMVWFDGACGEGVGGRKQEYDFPGYIELIREYQPNAVIFNDHGPDVRWIGNEGGLPRLSEWAVAPWELISHSDCVQTGPGPLKGDLSGNINPMLPELGSLQNILYSKGLCFCGAEADTSIRPGWFYHPDEEPHSLERLFEIYMDTVGKNACLNLNIPPMPNGLFDAGDVDRLRELGDLLKATFAHDLAADACIRREPGNGPTRSVYDIRLPGERPVNYIVLREDLAKGQRVENFCVDWQGRDGAWVEALRETTIGNKRICRLKGKQTDHLRVRITGARAEAELKDIRIY